MSNNTSQVRLSILRAKCAGAIAGLEKMEGRNHHSRLSKDFADDYNKILMAMGEFFLGMEDLIPPRATIEKYDSGNELCYTMPSEMLIYFHQLQMAIDCLLKGKNEQECNR